MITAVTTPVTQVSGCSEGVPGNVLSPDPEVWFETNDSPDPPSWIELTLPHNVVLLSLAK